MFILLNKCFKLSNTLNYVLPLVEQVFPIEQQSELCSSSCVTSVSKLSNNLNNVHSLLEQMSPIEQQSDYVHSLLEKMSPIKQQSELCSFSCGTSVSN